MFENITFSFSKAIILQNSKHHVFPQNKENAKTDMMFWMRVITGGKKHVVFWILPLWKKNVMVLYSAIWLRCRKKNVMCFDFYNIFACKRKIWCFEWMQRYYFVDRQKKRDVFDETPMVFFLFQKSTFVINENNITQNWNMDFFFFWFFIIYQLKIW